MIRPQLLGIALAFVVIAFLFGLSGAFGQSETCKRAPNGLAVVVDLVNDRHATLIEHERAAIAGDVPGELSPNPPAHAPRFLTWDPANGDERRLQSLRGIPKRAGFDRDEYPPASAREGGLQIPGDGSRASVVYVPSSENRSGGSRLGRLMAGYCSGQPFVIEAGRP